jgi:probable O-glycosylation ligase (exosortase A-associated)
MVYYSVLLFFLFDYLRPGNYVPGLDLLHLNAIVPAVAILGTLFKKSPVSNSQFFAEKNTKLMGALLVMLVVSTLLATVTMYAYDVTKGVFAYMLIYWVLVRQVGDIRRLKGVFMAIIVVHLLIAALNPGLFTDPDNRVGINSGAFLGDGNDFALSVNICVPMCLFLLIDSKRKIAKIGWSAALLGLVFCVVATKSRGGTLAFAVILFYFWTKTKRKVLTAVASMAIVAVVLATAPASYFARINTMTDTQESSAQGRIQAWTKGTQMALRSPLLGVGAGHFPMAYGGVSESRWMTAHSIYFLVLGELGFPGLIVLLWLIVSNLSANHRAQREVRELPPDVAARLGSLIVCCSAALMAFAVGGAFLSAAYYPHLYVLSGVLVAARHIARTQEHTATETTKAPTSVRKMITPGAVSTEWLARPIARAHAWHRETPGPLR